MMQKEYQGVCESTPLIRLKCMGFPDIPAKGMLKQPKLDIPPVIETSKRMAKGIMCVYACGVSYTINTSTMPANMKNTAKGNLEKKLVRIALPLLSHFQLSRPNNCGKDADMNIS